jgi:hypothetical protein
VQSAQGMQRVIERSLLLRVESAGKQLSFTIQNKEFGSANARPDLLAI